MTKRLTPHVCNILHSTHGASAWPLHRLLHSHNYEGWSGPCHESQELSHDMQLRYLFISIRLQASSHACCRSAISRAARSVQGLQQYSRTVVVRFFTKTAWCSDYTSSLAVHWGITMLGRLLPNQTRQCCSLRVKLLCFAAQQLPAPFSVCVHAGHGCDS